MSKLKAAPKIASSACILLFSCSLANSADKYDFSMSYTSINSVDLTDGSGKHLNKTDSSAVVLDLNGTEKSQCQPYGRSSSASGTARTSTVVQGNSVKLDLANIASTRGGHFRTCGAGCVGDNGACIFIHGNDTTASAAVKSETKVRISFSSDILQSNYDVYFNSNTPDNLNAVLTLPNRDRVTFNKNITMARIAVKPSEVLYLDVNINQSISNGGGCCESHVDTNSSADFRIERAPILDSNVAYEPFILGEETDGFPYVVGILKDGKMHCSGTAVSKTSVVTAAHCIQPFIDEIDQGRMSVFMGADSLNTSFGPVKVLNGVYPKAGDPFEYRGDSTQAHDIAVIYVENPFPLESYPVIHQGTPPWADVLKTKAVSFVGFGQNKAADGEKFGAGVKREASWHFNNADDYKLYFKVSKTGTCKGDSGGPAFLYSGDKFLLVGVTSEGEVRSCNEGFETRVDTHAAWLISKIK